MKYISLNCIILNCAPTFWTAGHNYTRFFFFLSTIKNEINEST